MDNPADSKPCGLENCSLQDGAAHGVFSGICEPSFYTLLSLFHAPASAYTVLVHGGAIILIIAQLMGGCLAGRTVNSRGHLVLCNFIQGITLLLLGISIASGVVPSKSIWIAVCLTSFVCVGVGNLAAPVWHSTWARVIKVGIRSQLLAQRNYYMIYGSLVAVILSFTLINSLDAKDALITLLTLAGISKLHSARRIKIAGEFLMLEPAKNHPIHKLELSKFAPHALFAKHDILAISSLHFGLGLCAALVIPYVTLKFGLTSQQIFALICSQMLGQLVCARVIQANAKLISANLLLLLAGISASVSPILLMLSGNLWSVLIVAIVNGVTMAMLGLGLQLLVQGKKEAQMVASAQVSITIITTLSFLLGGAFILILENQFSLSQLFLYNSVFVAGTLFRMLSVVSLIRSRAI